MRTAAKALIGLAGFAVAWFVFWSVDFEYERTTVLSPHLRLIERWHATRSPWSPVGSSGALPIPYRSDDVVRQTMLRGSEVLWSDIGLFKRRKLAPSPDESLVSMQSATERENLVVFVTDSRVSVDVPLPESVAPRSDSPYPLIFHAWSADSRTLYLRTSESLDWGRDVDHWYREIYRVKPATGAAELAVHCTSDKPFSETHGPPDWSATPCANSARP